MFDPKQLLRTHLSILKPYSSARDEFSGTANIFVDANENAVGSATEKTYNRYPDPLQWKVKEKLGLIKGVDVNQIFLGNGSDEAIDLLFRAFCEPSKNNVIIMPPTYGMYKVCADTHGVLTRESHLNENFEIDLNTVNKCINANTQIIFVCSPNNPSGNSLNKETIEKIIQNFSGIVVVDEAYIDYSNEASFISKLDSYPNLVVLQTFSKAWGMAGLRLGAAYASKAIIDILNKIKMPYNLNQVTQELALEALENHKKTTEMVKDCLEERENLKHALSTVNGVQKIYPSDANFLLVKIDQATEVYDYLVTKGIIVRNRSKISLCDDCLRITVGTKQENEILIRELKNRN